MHTLDIVGSVLDIAVVFLFIRASLFAWPVGIIATIVDGVLFLQANLYADMVLQGIYFLSMIYGWYYWLKGGKAHHHATIHHTPIVMGILLAIIATVSIALIAFLLRHYTNSNTPIADAATTVLALVAQWLACRKLIENWLLWLIVDSMYLLLYDYKHLSFHAAENIVYLVLAVIGWVNWQRLYRHRQIN
ncbi:MAG: nicotinamide riboside transporter PnuC [Pseudomonadota bacterium]